MHLALDSNCIPEIEKQAKAKVPQPGREDGSKEELSNIQNACYSVCQAVCVVVGHNHLATALYCILLRELFSEVFGRDGPRGEVNDFVCVYLRRQFAGVTSLLQSVDSGD